MQETRRGFGRGIHIDRNEVAGAFGDLGTDLPLLIGVIIASGFDVASVFVVFGAMQVLSALRYRLPMPVQPLKAVAAIVIAQGLSPEIVYGGGLAIGVIMLLFTVTGLVDWLGAFIPKAVVRGVQFGLGLKLATVATGEYMLGDKAMPDLVLAVLCFLIAAFLIGNRKYPAALLIVGIGLIYSAGLSWQGGTLAFPAPGFDYPKWFVPQWSHILDGFLLLALPQIPLSIGNSLLATHRLTADFFPERGIRLRDISATYSLMNLISPFLSGFPVCHGSGGLAGHYAFGARSGGSVLLYGVFFLVVGLFFSKQFESVMGIFPLPVLGVILLFEALALLALLRDVSGDEKALFVALLVGLVAALLPYGFLIGMVVGTGVHYWKR